MTGHRALHDLYGTAVDYTVEDAGDTNDIMLKVDRHDAHVPLVTTGSETRTLGNPVYEGQMLLLSFQTDGGDCTVTASRAYDQAGGTVLTFKNAGEFVLLKAIKSGSNLVWRIIGFDGVIGPSLQSANLFAGGGGHNVETLTGTKTLVVGDATFQKLDPGGSARDLNLPAEAVSKGKAFRITNAANAAEAITVKDDSPATVVTLSQNEATWVACDGTTWEHMGIETIALT